MRGLWEVIDPQWLQMFSEPELQVLISGSNKTLDVEDLKRHTRQAYSIVERSGRRTHDTCWVAEIFIAVTDHPNTKTKHQ